MTTFPFLPSSQAPFQFQPTLDGTVYNVVVNWNFFGRRYYVNIYQLNGVLIVCLPLIESDAGINLQSLSWASGKVTAVTATPHNHRVGETVDFTISGVSPSEYNGKQQCLITAPSEFTYLLSSDPGGTTQLGVVGYDISMTAGYFVSTLVFRQSQFVVTP